MHVVDGLEEGEHSAVIGDAASTHVVAFHPVKESGDGVLQSLQKLLVVLLRLPILVLLLEAETRGRQRAESHLWFAFFTSAKHENTASYIHPQHNTSIYLHYADWLDRDMSFYRLSDCWQGLSQWHRGRG